AASSSSRWPAARCGGAAEGIRAAQRPGYARAVSMIHTVYHPGTSGPDALPTVVAIHGHGANGFDLLGLGPYLAAGRVLLLCPEAEFSLQPGLPSFTWFETAPPQRRSEREFER